MILALSRRDALAIRRVMEWCEEDARAEAYRSISRADYVKLSGRDARVLASQAERYGIPVGGGTIDLAAVLGWFHDFLAEAGRRFFSTSGEDPMSGPTSPALEKWRHEKWLLARINRREKEGELLPTERVRDAMMTMARSLRAGCQLLEKQFGREGREAYEQILDSVEREVNNLFDSWEVVAESEEKEAEPAE